MNPQTFPIIRFIRYPKSIQGKKFKALREQLNTLLKDVLLWNKDDVFVNRVLHLDALHLNEGWNYADRENSINLQVPDKYVETTKSFLEHFYSKHAINSSTDLEERFDIIHAVIDETGKVYSYACVFNVKISAPYQDVCGGVYVGLSWAGIMSLDLKSTNYSLDEIIAVINEQPLPSCEICPEVEQDTIRTLYKFVCYYDTKTLEFKTVRLSGKYRLSKNGNLIRLNHNAFSIPHNGLKQSSLGTYMQEGENRFVLYTIKTRYDKDAALFYKHATKHLK